MIDRKSREELTRAIEEYLGDEISAFDFDERINNIETEDESVSELILALWFFYGDCKDHHVVLEKPEWDYFQRILLFLRTDYSIADRYREIKKKKKDWTQLVALVALIVQASIILYDSNLLISTLFAGGLISIPVWMRRNEIKKELVPPEDRKQSDWLQLKLYPFSGYSDIALAKKKTGFVKESYPSMLVGRRIRSEVEEKLLLLDSTLRVWFLLHFIFSPIVLLVECFSISDSITESPNKAVVSTPLRAPRSTA